MARYPWLGLTCAAAGASWAGSSPSLPLLPALNSLGPVKPPEDDREWLRPEEKAPRPRLPTGISLAIGFLRFSGLLMILPAVVVAFGFIGVSWAGLIVERFPESRSNFPLVLLSIDITGIVLLILYVTIGVMFRVARLLETANDPELREKATPSPEIGRTFLAECLFMLGGILVYLAAGAMLGSVIRFATDGRALVPPLALYALLHLALAIAAFVWGKRIFPKRRPQR